MDYKKVYIGSEIVTNTIPEVYFSQNPNKLFLLVNSSCNNEKRKGNYRVMLKYKNSNKLLTENLINVSDAGECSLLGIKQAIKAINTPNFEINIITGIGLGFQGTLNKGKCSHKDLVYEILDDAKEKNLKIKEVIFKGNSNSIKTTIDTAFPLSKAKGNDPKEKVVDLKVYSKILREEIEKELKTKIVLNMANLRFNKETISKAIDIPIEEVKKILKL